MLFFFLPWDMEAEYSGCASFSSFAWLDIATAEDLVVDGAAAVDDGFGRDSDDDDEDDDEEVFEEEDVDG